MQFLRPFSQLDTNGQWTDQGSSSVNMHLAIDEVSLDETDYIQAFGSGAGGDPTEYYAVFSLSSVSTPAQANNHTFRVQALWIGGTIDIKVQIIRISTLALVREEFISLSNTSTQYSFALTSPEIAALSGGYDAGGGVSDIKIKILRTAHFSATRAPRVFQAFLEVPDAGFEHLDMGSGPGLKVVGVGTGNYLEAPSNSGLKRVSGVEGATALIISSGTGVKIHG